MFEVPDLPDRNYLNRIAETMQNWGEINKSKNNIQRDLFLLSLDSDVFLSDFPFLQGDEKSNKNQRVMGSWVVQQSNNYLASHPLLCLVDYVVGLSLTNIIPNDYTKSRTHNEEIIAHKIALQLYNALENTSKGAGVIRVEYPFEPEDNTYSINHEITDIIVNNQHQIEGVLYDDVNLILPYLESPLKTLQSAGFKAYTDYVQTEKLKLYIKEQFTSDFILPSVLKYDTCRQVRDCMIAGWEQMGLSAPVH